MEIVVGGGVGPSRSGDTTGRQPGRRTVYYGPCFRHRNSARKFSTLDAYLHERLAISDNGGDASLTVFDHDSLMPRKESNSQVKGALSLRHATRAASRCECAGRAAAAKLLFGFDRRPRGVPVATHAMAAAASIAAVWRRHLCRTPADLGPDEDTSRRVGVR